MQVDISRFKKDCNFYGEISLLLSVKSFNLGEIRARYIASKLNKSNRTGSVERRSPSIGGILTVILKQGKIYVQREISRMKEPRGIDYSNGNFAIASENTVFLFQKGKLSTLNNEWFSYIHTVKFNSNNKLLVSSSGYDCLLEFDLNDFTKTWEWFAWENGFDTGKDPLTGAEFKLTRSEQQAAEYNAKGIPFLLFNDPQNQTLPTARRSAFINTANYSSDEKSILATFFHKGAVYRIDKANGMATLVIDGMKNPHGGSEFSKGLMATSTGSGEIVFKTIEGEQKLFAGNLPGKHEGLEKFEWIQNTILIDNFLIAIDSNRTSFLIVDIQNQRYDLVPYNPDWAVQDLINIENIENTQVLKEELERASKLYLP